MEQNHTPLTETVAKILAQEIDTAQEISPEIATNVLSKCFRSVFSIALTAPDERILIPGIGLFEIKHVRFAAAKNGGEPMPVPRFTPSDELRNMVAAHHGVQRSVTTKRIVSESTLPANPVVEPEDSELISTPVTSAPFPDPRIEGLEIDFSNI